MVTVFQDSGLRLSSQFPVFHYNNFLSLLLLQSLLVFILFILSRGTLS